MFAYSLNSHGEARGSGVCRHWLRANTEMAVKWVFSCRVLWGVTIEVYACSLKGELCPISRLEGLPLYIFRPHIVLTNMLSSSTTLNTSHFSTYHFYQGHSHRQLPTPAKRSDHIVFVRPNRPSFEWFCTVVQHSFPKIINLLSA